MPRVFTKVLGVFLVVGLLACSALLWTMTRVSPDFEPKAFDSATWKATPATRDRRSTRLRMVDDLLDHHDFHGWTQDQLIWLLGAPDKTEYFRDYDMAYYLGPERSVMSVDSEWLVVKFTANKTILEYRVATD
jgi:hypothetical protein